MNETEIINSENRLMANVFAKKPIVLARGKGATVWDINGKEYVDCTSSYGVALLGHSHPKIVKAVCEQAGKLISCHAGFYSYKNSLKSPQKDWTRHFSQTAEPNQSSAQ